MQGIRGAFDRVLLLRQAHGFAFGKSDIFVLCAVVPEQGQVEVSAQVSVEQRADASQGLCM